MKQLHKLEMTFDKEPNNPMILETNAHELNTNEPHDRMIIETNTKDLKNLKPTTDTERDIVQDCDQLPTPAADKTFLEGLPMSQRRWVGPTDTPKDHKTICKRIFHYVAHCHHRQRLHEHGKMQAECACSTTPDPTQLEEMIHTWKEQC
jgi:hypothetical protein